MKSVIQLQFFLRLLHIAGVIPKLRASTFDYDGTKRFGDYDADAEEWKRYHWCQSQLLGYEDDSNTYYIVPDREGSTKLIISSGAVVNRIEYDHLGRIRSQTTAPQVELLWRGMFYNSDCSLYMINPLYSTKFGQALSFINGHYYSLSLGSLFQERRFKKQCDWFDDIIDFLVTLPIPGLWNILVPSSTGPEFIPSAMCMMYRNQIDIFVICVENCTTNPLCTADELSSYQDSLINAILMADIFCTESPF